MSEGKKFDNAKVRVNLIDPDFLYEVGAILTFGAAQYGDYNWRSVSEDRYYAALYRHLLDMQRGKTMDSELPKMSHAAAIACNSMFLWYSQQKQNLVERDPAIINARLQAALDALSASPNNKWKATVSKDSKVTILENSNENKST
jgi:hypothetical protein